MVLNDFVKSVLVGIASGVKEANSEMKGDTSKPSFALKNSTFFEDKGKGCVEFNVVLENRDSLIHVSHQTKQEEIGNRVKFNVVQIMPIS
ncbi:MAG: hypothetical protein V4519_05290 [Patescibacteria group bacterium]